MRALTRTQILNFARSSVAVRLAGGGAREIAAAGKPDCYRKARKPQAFAFAFDLHAR